MACQKSLLLILMLWTVRSHAQLEFPIHPDSLRQDGVPAGEVLGPFEMRCETFPGTVRNYWVYVPEQYSPRSPAATCVCQDGLGLANGWKLPVVFDNLIHKKEMPVTVGIFVSPGIVPPRTSGSQPRFNRSFEYDSMGPRYAKFVVEITSRC